MGLYGALFRNVLYPAWETVLKRRPTLARLDYLERTQWASRDELLAIQSGSLRRLVQHAYDNVPYYRERFTASGVSPEDIRTPEDLRKLPLLTRVGARLTTAERTSTRGPNPTIQKTTGGTTGEPLLFGYEPDSEYWRHAVKMRGYAWSGYRHGHRALQYWGFPSSGPSRQRRLKMNLDRQFRRDYYVDCTRRGDDDLRAVVDVIRKFKPEAIVCYTQAGGDLARFILKHGLRDWGTIPVICGAERLFQHDRQSLEGAFGKAVFETYGCREVMLIGSECDAHDGLHQSVENLVVEVIVKNPDGTTRAAEEGELGEVVLTDLHNLAMPFLRYANGDLATQGPSTRCACGRNLPRIRSVEGRTTACLRDGQGRPVGGMIFNLIFSALAATVRQFQAVQHRDGSITLKVIPSGELDVKAREHVRKNCEIYLPGVPVTLEEVSEISLSSSGKRQPVLVEEGP